MEVDKALKVYIKPENLHIMGLTPLHPHENKMQGSQFFAFLRLIKEIPEQDGFKWLYVPNDYGYCNFLAVKVIHHKKAGYMIKFKYAQSI